LRKNKGAQQRPIPLPPRTRTKPIHLESSDSDFFNPMIFLFIILTALVLLTAWDGMAEDRYD
jgi:hypothetical protein